jgi:hypothetical protein
MKEEMEGKEVWWEHISEDKKKAFIKAKLDFKMRRKCRLKWISLKNRRKFSDKPPKLDL